MDDGNLILAYSAMPWLVPQMQSFDVHNLTPGSNRSVYFATNAEPESLFQTARRFCHFVSAILEYYQKNNQWTIPVFKLGRLQTAAKVFRL